MVTRGLFLWGQWKDGAKLITVPISLKVRKRWSCTSISEQTYALRTALWCFRAWGARCKLVTFRGAYSHDWRWVVEFSWNVTTHGDAREGKWRGNWRMEWVASTLHTTSEHGVSSITTADAHTSAASSRLNWCPRRFKWTRPFRRKTKSGFCACVITFQTQSSPAIRNYISDQSTTIKFTDSYCVFSLYYNYCAASSGNSLPTFRDNVSVIFSRVKIGPIVKDQVF